MRPRRRWAALLVATLPALTLAGGCAGEVVHAPPGGRLRSGRARRHAARRRAHHLCVLRLVQRRLPRDPAAQRESPSTTSASSENGRAYRGQEFQGNWAGQGPCGAARDGTSVRIVSHYQANGEIQTFAGALPAQGIAVAYDDVVDANLPVWGSVWKEPLGRLTATEAAPWEDPPRVGPSRLRAW